jgi:retron-type reverse transcriptase
MTMMPSNKAPGNDTVHLRILKDCLSSVVQPFTSIINSSFLKGIFSSQWKISEITPIPKNDDYEEAENDRPISLLPVLSKVCERVVHNQLTNYLIPNERFPTNQSGNRKQHSTETLGFAVTDYILDAMDRKQIIAMVLLDFNKAFDSVSHSLLLKKLQNFGVSQNALRWFASYLFRLKQQVRIGKTLSSSRTVTHGVPQGSILGPQFLNLYIYDLPNPCTESEIDSFVDETNSMQHLKLLIWHPA